MSTATKITLPENITASDYRCWYGSQNSPQNGVVQLDEEGRISIDYINDNSSTPIKVWSGHVTQWAFSPWVSAGDLRKALDELREELQRVLEGREEVYDGQRERVRLTDDAQEASEAIERHLEALEASDEDCDEVAADFEMCVCREGDGYGPNCEGCEYYDGEND